MESGHTQCAWLTIITPVKKSKDNCSSSPVNHLKFPMDVARNYHHCELCYRQLIPVTVNVPAEQFNSESESRAHLFSWASSSSVLPTWKYNGWESAPLRVLLKLPTLLMLDVLPRKPSASMKKQNIISSKAGVQGSSRKQAEHYATFKGLEHSTLHSK